MMIGNAEKLAAFERELTARTPIDIDRNFKILDDLYQHARSLGIFPLSDPLEGIDDTIRLARLVNSVSKGKD